MILSHILCCDDSAPYLIRLLHSQLSDNQNNIIALVLEISAKRDRVIHLECWLGVSSWRARPTFAFDAVIFSRSHDLLASLRTRVAPLSISLTSFTVSPSRGGS